MDKGSSSLLATKPEPPHGYNLPDRSGQKQAEGRSGDMSARQSGCCTVGKEHCKENDPAFQEHQGLVEHSGDCGKCEACVRRYLPNVMCDRKFNIPTPTTTTTAPEEASASQPSR